MSPDCIDSQNFYQSATGRAVQELLRDQIEKMWADVSNERILPLGCGGMLLGSLPVVSGCMTGAQEETFSCLVDSRNKPLPDADIDRVLFLHAAKTSSDMESLLREAWRVLKGEGRVLLIVPKRGSAWALKADTPFGREQAYSPSEIRNILKRQGFFISRSCSVLYAPPCGEGVSVPCAKTIEAIAPWVLLGFGGGVLIVEARKRVCGFAGQKKQKRQRYSDPPIPLPLPI